MYRDHTKVVQIGNRKIGGGNPVLIQSMTNTKTEDVEATVRQILELEAAGCEIIRCAVPTMEAAEALREIKKQILQCGCTVWNVSDRSEWRGAEYLESGGTCLCDDGTGIYHSHWTMHGSR